MVNLSMINYATNEKKNLDIISFIENLYFAIKFKKKLPSNMKINDNLRSKH